MKLALPINVYLYWEIAKKSGMDVVQIYGAKKEGATKLGFACSLTTISRKKPLNPQTAECVQLGRIVRDNL